VSLAASFKLHICVSSKVCFKHQVGVNITTPNWAVLQTCGRTPLQFCWFHAAAKFLDSLLCRNNGLLKKIVHTDIALSANKKCWTVEFIEACEA